MKSIDRATRQSPRHALCGFTILELLTVIAIIGILASVLIPVVGRVQINAKKAKTRVQFSQWAAAIEAFRQEYGFYPTFPSVKVNGPAATPDVFFMEVLTGRGTVLGPPPSFASGALSQNPKRISFYSFGNDEVRGNTNIIADAFGNGDITVLTDANYDGVIPAADVNEPAAEVTADEGTSSLRPANVPTNGIRAGVVFFSAGVGQNGSDVVTSW